MGRVPCPVARVAWCDMQAIRTKDSNFTYKGPAPSIADLPCEVDDSTVTAVFKLTPEERQRVADGAHLTLVIIQRPMPPIALGVAAENVEEQWAEGDLVCEDCGAVWLAERELLACGHCGGRLGQPA
jgi:hypothetical protein